MLPDTLFSHNRSVRELYAGGTVLCTSTTIALLYHTHVRLVCVEMRILRSGTDKLSE